MQRTDNPTLQTMSKSMLIVMIFMMTSKVTGFLRETVLAANYGLSSVTDAFKFAQNLPNFILGVVIAAIAATFIPVYHTRMQDGEEKAARFVNNIYTMGLLLSLVLSLITFVLLKPLTLIFMHGTDAATQQLTIRLAQIMMPMAVFTFLSQLTTAFLQAKFRFAVPSIAPLFGNIAILVSIVLSRGESIEIVAIGSFVAMMIQFVVQVPFALRAGLRYQPVLDFYEHGIREVMMLMIPIVIASAFDQLYGFFDRMVASAHPGDISALDYGNRVSTMISAVLLTTIATVLYPNLVRDSGDSERFQEHLGLGVNLNLLIALPAMFAMVILQLPLTRLVYERGAFTAQDTLVTAGTLSCYSMGLLGVGIRELCNRGFFALKKTKVPTIVGIAAVLLNIVLNYTFYPIWRSAGVAFATAVSSSLSGIALLILLNKQLGKLPLRTMGICLGKSFLSAAVMGAALWAGMAMLTPLALTGMSSKLAVLGLVVGGVLIYAGMLYLLRVEELRVIMGMVRGKLPRGKGVSG